MMFVENLAVLSIAVAAAAFAWVRALDTAFGTSTLPIPTTITSCIQQCFDQAELQSGCNGYVPFQRARTHTKVHVFDFYY